MRVRDFAASVGIEPAAALEFIQASGLPNAPTHANSSIPEDILAKLKEQYPQLASVNTADSPEVETAPAAPAAPTADPTPTGASQSAPVAQTPASPAPAPIPPSSPLHVVPQSPAPQDNGDPAARSAVARKAVERQYITNPAPVPRKWEVSYPGAGTIVVEAIDENEAWAKYNDAAKKSYPPRLRRVVEMTPEKEAAIRAEALKAAQAAAGIVA